ncbi:MAG: alpha/beta-type small acid-soluble spore protein [Firmicutes bacterium]|nr:alpha/beta-type small acid-soluble spore protein [Bacillota bacterium]
MAGSRKSKLLVPECYDALNQFKMEVANELGLSQNIKENNDHYKGDVPSKVNGQQGGPIGGEMVKRMIRTYEQQMK